ncbi:MAG: hypothetical protein KBG92_07025 [Spirochaetes bacterium]|nr:hypothetical protein [Spirochaetota bacterium]HOE21162.1 hypothetical protein [Spirochaetota bacterium]HQL44170.1 hypothetical protein [Spirochaetota bacterium]
MLYLIIIPTLLMAATAQYVSVLYSILYVQIKDEPKNFWFALICFTIAWYDIFSAGA